MIISKDRIRHEQGLEGVEHDFVLRRVIHFQYYIVPGSLRGNSVIRVDLSKPGDILLKLALCHVLSALFKHVRHHLGGNPSVVVVSAWHEVVGIVY